MDMDMDALDLKQYINLDFLQKYLENFSKCMGITVGAIDINHAFLTQTCGATEFCRDLTRGTVEGSKRCIKCDLQGGEQASKTGRPFVYHCHAGLVDFAVPIMIGDEQVGSIIGGQVLTESPDEEKFRKIADEIGVDPDKYMAALRKIKIVPEQDVQAAAELLYLVANNLSKMGYQQYKLKNMAEILHENLSQIAAAMEQLAASAIEVTENEAALRDEINDVHSHSEQINNVLGFIKQVADETKMLGLNAAIEAARAGEVGRGFGVVADEIRKLSSESKHTANQISALTLKIIKSIEKTIESSNKTLEASEQQSAAIEEINAGIEEITSLSDQLIMIATF